MPKFHTHAEELEDSGVVKFTFSSNRDIPTAPEVAQF